MRVYIEDELWLDCPLCTPSEDPDIQRAEAILVSAPRRVCPICKGEGKIKRLTWGDVEIDMDDYGGGKAYNEGYY